MFYDLWLDIELEFLPDLLGAGLAPRITHHTGRSFVLSTSPEFVPLGMNALLCYLRNLDGDWRT